MAKKDIEVKRMDKVEFMFNNKKRRGIIVQNNVGNRFSPTTIVVEYNPLKIRKKLTKPYLIISLDNERSSIEITNIRTISKTRITKVLGRVKGDNVKKVNSFLKKSTNNQYFKVVYANLMNTEGSEQSGLRPCVYIENFNLVIPITSKTKKIGTLPTHIGVSRNKKNNLAVDSVVISEHIRNIEEENIKDIIGVINNEKAVKGINETIKVSILS